MPVRLDHPHVALCHAERPMAKQGRDCLEVRAVVVHRAGPGAAKVVRAEAGKSDILADTLQLIPNGLAVERNLLPRAHERTCGLESRLRRRHLSKAVAFRDPPRLGRNADQSPGAVNIARVEVASLIQARAGARDRFEERSVTDVKNLVGSVVVLTQRTARRALLVWSPSLLDLLPELARVPRPAR